MTSSKRSLEKELLDGDNIPFADIAQNLKELNTINTLLGGHKITLQGIKKLAEKRKMITICEIGCGGGDNLLAIADWCNRKNIEAKFIGIDIKQSCIDFAQKKLTHLQVRWIQDDYANVLFDSKPDIIFSSLFCHHFTNGQVVEQLKWMKDNSSIGFFINDLHRHPVAYYLIKWLTGFFSKSYLVKNDAPLSVARAFTKNEWIKLLKAANLTTAEIQWKWAFRYLITYRHA